MRKIKKSLMMSILILFSLSFTPMLNMLIQQNPLIVMNSPLHQLYYDSVNWTVPYGDEPVIIDGILNSNGWDEWSDAQVEIICFNYSVSFYGDNSRNFAAYLYLKHNLTHKLIALDVNWTPSESLMAENPSSRAGQCISTLYENMKTHNSGNSTWNEKGIYGVKPDQFLIYFNEIYGSDLDNGDETCVRANDTGPSDGYYNSTVASMWMSDKYSQDVWHARGLYVFEIAVPIGSSLDTEDLDKDDIATRGQEVMLGVLFGYGRYMYYETYQPYFEKGEPENTYGYLDGVSQSNRWDSNYDGDPWPDSTTSTDMNSFDLMIQTLDFYDKPLDGSRIPLTPGVSNTIAGRTSGGWLATTLNITPAGPAEFTMNASEDPPQGIPPAPDVASLYLNFTLNTSLAVPAMVRIYFNVSNGQVETQGIFAVSNMTPVYYNESKGEWVEITPFIINEVEGYVEFYLTHFSFYAIIGKETQNNNETPPPIPGFAIFFVLISLLSISVIYIIHGARKAERIQFKNC